MKKATLAMKAMVILPMVLAILACNPVENETNSHTILVIESVLGVDAEGNNANYLESDVLFEDEEEGTATIFADPATILVRASLLDPASVTGPSLYNDVTINRYTVDYMRSDGKNTPGVDVPLPFEGTLTQIAAVGESVQFTLVIVRAAAKAEPPLVNLQSGRDEGILTVQAKITLYGHDQANRTVTATGYLTIYFANYVND
jgi:hypothetical protein